MARSRGCCGIGAGRLCVWMFPAPPRPVGVDIHRDELDGEGGWWECCRRWLDEMGKVIAFMGPLVRIALGGGRWVMLPAPPREVCMKC